MINFEHISKEAVFVGVDVAKESIAVFIDETAESLSWSKNAVSNHELFRANSV